MSERRLGMGLDALLPSNGNTNSDEVDIKEIEPNPFQPRQRFDQKELQDLCESIKKIGILEPLVVRRVNSHYQLVAGERRLRASQLAGVTRVPIRIVNVSDTDMLKFALVENLQRKDLNPIEMARAFKTLNESFQMTHEEIGQLIGIDRATVSNMIRLLDTPEEVRNALAEGKITVGHARVLLACRTVSQQIQILRRIMAEGLSVRETEDLVYAEPKRTVSRNRDPQVTALENELSDALGTRVKIRMRNGKGAINLRFFSVEQFNAIYQKLKAQ